MGDADDAPVDPGGEAVDALAGDQHPPGLLVAGVGKLGLVEGLVAAGERLPFGAVAGARAARSRSPAQRTRLT